MKHNTIFMYNTYTFDSSVLCCLLAHFILINLSNLTNQLNNHHNLINVLYSS